ncbi:MAG: S-layer homology domain-containing protein [Desulfotomaculaceae bacterium]
MKRILVLILTGLMVMALSTGAAWAKPDNTKQEAAKAKVSAMKLYKAQYKVMVDGKMSVKSNKFKDTDKHWGSAPIQRMTAMGLFAGYDDGTFRPNNNISQAEMIALLMRLVDTNSNDDEEDVDEDVLDEVPGWARDSVKQAAKLKIMSLNRFHSAQQASRAQTCIAFAKALEKEGYLDLDEFNIDPDNLPFADGKLLLDNDDLVYILAMYQAGYIKGAPGNKFLPNNAITRAEMAAILERILADLKEDDDGEDEYELSDLEGDLLGDYKKIKDVRVSDINLDGDKDEVDVKVEVDLEYYDVEWADLSDRDIKDWLEDLVGDIQDELSRYTEVNGEIINNDNDAVLVKFSKEGTGRLSVIYKDDDYRDAGGDVNEVELALKGDQFDVGNVEFKITRINYDVNDNEIMVDLKAQEDFSSTQWNYLDVNGYIDDDVENICAEIAEAFQNDADAEPVMIYLDLYDDDSNLLESYEYDVANESLD